MSDDEGPGQATDATEQLARYDGGVAVGMPADAVGLPVIPRADRDHRRAYGLSIRDGGTHDHDDDEIPARIRGLLQPLEAHSACMHLHPAALAGPLAIVTAALAAAIALNAYAYAHHQAGPLLVHVIWLGFTAAALWYAWRSLQWQVTWLAVTPRRMMLVSGWPARRAVSLPVRRMRDVELMQTPVGRWLGYGTLIAPSVSTGHALAVVRYVPDPERTYRMLWAMIEPAKGESPAPVEVE